MVVMKDSGKLNDEMFVGTVKKFVKKLFTCDFKFITGKEKLRGLSDKDKEVIL